MISRITHANVARASAARSAAPKKEDQQRVSDRVRLQNLKPLESPKKAIETLIEGYGYVEFPQVSPDGERLTFNVVHDYSTSQILVTDTQGGPVKALDTGEKVEPEALDGYLEQREGHIWEQASWTADGEHLLYRTNERGTFGLGRYSVADSNREMLLHDPALNMKHPTEMPDGRVVCYGGPPSEQYATVDRYSNIFLADPKSGTTEQITHSTGEVAFKHPASDGDGQILAHLEDKSAGLSDIIRLSPEGEVEKLTETPLADERHPFHNPEVDLLVYHRKEAGDKNLVLSTPDGNRTAQLTFYGRPAQSPCWSPDGKKIYFVKKDMRQPDGEPFYNRQAAIRVIDVERALKDLTKQAEKRLKKLKKASPELKALAAEQLENYRYFLRRYE